MGIKDFIKSLLGVNNKDYLQAEVKNTIDELKRISDTYKLAADLTKNFKYKDPTIKEMVDRFKSNFPGQDSGNPVAHISNNLETVIKNAECLQKIIETAMSNKVVAKGLSYKQAAVVQYLNAVSLVTIYSRKWLNAIFIYEAAQYSISSTVVEESITKAERDWLQNTYLDFIQAYKAACHDPEKTVERLNEVPEIGVEESSEAVLARTVGMSKLDPLRCGLIATKANPILFVRMMFTEWQVSRYNETKEELNQIELRILQLKELQKERNDPRLEKKIAESESRLQYLQDKLADLGGGA